MLLKKIFKNIVKLCFFSTINAPKRHFSTFLGIPFFCPYCSSNALSILFQYDINNTVFIRGFMGSAPPWIPSFVEGENHAMIATKRTKGASQKTFFPCKIL